MKANDARLALEDATPLLVETLQSHWSTGQGTRVRHILWSLYTCGHLVNLGDACSGLDTQLAAAVHAALTARLVLGPDSEKQLGHILDVSGEFTRYDQVEKMTPNRLPVLYPPNSTDSDELRRLADAADFLAERIEQEQRQQEDRPLQGPSVASTKQGTTQKLTPPGSGIRV